MSKETTQNFSDQKVFYKEEEHLFERGKDLVSWLHASIKTAQIYEKNNDMFRNQSERLFALVSELVEKEGEIALVYKGGYLFLNDLRLKFDLEKYADSKFVMETFEKFDWGRISIEEGITSEELDILICIIGHLESEEEEIFDLFEKEIHQQGISHIKVERIPPFKKDEYEKSLKENRRLAKQTFFNSVSMVKEVMSSLEARKTVSIVRVKRVVQSLVDLILDDEATFLELTALKNFDEYTYVHSANVCVFSIMCGARLGFDKNRLCQLGFSALFHDLGKVKLPHDLINKPDRFDDSDWVQIRRHPLLGVKTILSSRRLDSYSMRAIVVAFEHHLNLDLSGYPKVDRGRKLNLFSRIVSIADAYDAMTSGRVYNKEPYSPDEALRRMFYRSGAVYD
ncbi:MAG: hypothetical protein AMJ90_05880, partial [candidate division Zixibacteria bacterium SM23_73_2]